MEQLTEINTFLSQKNDSISHVFDRMKVLGYRCKSGNGGLLTTTLTVPLKAPFSQKK